MLVVCPHCQKLNRVPLEKTTASPQCGACSQDLFTGHPFALDFQGLQRNVQRGEIPLLVDFWAPWCGPCRTMAPAFQEAAGRLEPQVRLAKVNTEEAEQAGMIYGIRSIPTMILFKEGQEAARTSGAMNTQQIENWVRPHLA